MIKLAKKTEYNVGIMTGSFHTDYSYRIADSVCDALNTVDADVHTVLMQSMDAKRYLSFTSSADESFDRHYYSLFEYGKYLKLDLLIVSFGTISAVSSSMSISDFLEPFRKIPVIVLEDESPVDNGISVVVDNYSGMRACVEHLVKEHGLKNILFVSGPDTVPDAAMRLKAFLDTMRENDLKASKETIAFGDFTDKVDPLIEKLLDRNPDAEAICCANDEMAESAYRVIKKRGLTPGKDIMVTGFDDSGSAAYMDPPLTTVRQSFDKVAESVGKLVRQLIAGCAVSSVKIPAELMVRESCGCSLAPKKNESDTQRLKVSEDLLRIKNLQTKSIMSSLLLRALFSGEYKSREFFERFGNALKDAGTKKAFVCLVGRPINASSTNGYFLPDKLNTYLTLNGDSVGVRGYGEGKVMNADQLSSMLLGHAQGDRQLAVFPLFYRDEHYGALFVELDRKDMLFYYTLSLELGTGLYFLKVELENEDINHTLKNQNRTLEYSASHDSLTNCFNRETVMREARGILKRQGGGSEYIIAIADIDHLKQINANFGHLEGDAAIIETAAILKKVLPENGIIGRLGGDEFMCFFPYSAGDSSMSFKNKVKKCCDDYNETSRKPYYLSVTVGYHSFNKDDEIPFRDLFKMADKQLLIDKKMRESLSDGRTDSIIRVKATPLSRYVKQTEEIRALSVPELRDIIEVGAYRENLLMNYKVIGELANDNESILNEHVYPFFKGEKKLDQQNTIDMLDFAHALENSNQGEYPDSTLAYRQGLYLLSEADRIDDDYLRIEALNEIMSSARIKLHMTERLLPVSDICGKYSEVAVSASQRMREYLDKEKFAELPDESKRLVISSLQHAPFIARIESFAPESKDGPSVTEKTASALELCRDPFYHDQLPSYDWDLHECAMLENILSVAYYDDSYAEGGKGLGFMNECASRIATLHEDSELAKKEQFDLNCLKVVLYKNSFLAGDITKEEYKCKLIKLAREELGEDQSRKSMISKLFAYIEFMRNVDRDAPAKEEIGYLREFYNMLIPYAGEATKLPTAMLLFTYFAMFLENFTEIPGEFSFEDMGLLLIASVHPPSFVHSLTMASLSRVLTRHLLMNRPELFLDMPGIESVEDVNERRGEIEEFVYKAARIHDIGKLFVVETILTYGRKLIDDEKEIIKVHPSIGAFLLSRFPENAKYADVARGHHKWFDNKGGYPEDFDLDASPYKTIVSIVACADCLDAATDTIGRSYKHGKTLNEMVGELRAGSGTRFAPYVVELLSDDNVLREISDILEGDRDNNYKETYYALKKYEIS